MRNYKRVLPWIFVILWMMLIFYLSSQPAAESDNLSTGITETIIKIVGKIAPGLYFSVGSYNHILRKNAHFFAYLVLGMLTTDAFGRSGMYGKKSLISAALLCVLYAVSDETHQLFVPGRGAQVMDVVIDSAGVGTGMALYVMASEFVGRFSAVRDLLRRGH